MAQDPLQGDNFFCHFPLPRGRREVEVETERQEGNMLIKERSENSAALAAGRVSENHQVLIIKGFRTQAEC